MGSGGAEGDGESADDVLAVHRWEGHGLRQLQPAQLDRVLVCEPQQHRVQRAHAELANFRRRTLEDQSIQRIRITVSVVRSFLPVLDGLEAAVKAGTDEGGDEAIREGLAMIAERVDSVLKDLKVEKIDSKGEDFNPELHEAMLQVDQPDARQGEIVEEVEKGYRCGDLLVRAARVVVARGSESAE